jgi:hypothetical protein
MSWRRSGWALVAGASCLLGSPGAKAAAPGNWAFGVERIFGFSSVTTRTKVGNGTESTSVTAASLFSDVGGRPGYSTPRLSLDYVLGSGVSLGGAVGYQSVSADDNGSDSIDNGVKGWLFAPRIGFYASVTSGIGIWPRGGVTYISLDPGGGDSRTATALTVEVPLVFVVGGRLGLDVMPYVDLGVGGGTNTVDQKITELGLEFGLSYFF